MRPSPPTNMVAPISSVFMMLMFRELLKQKARKLSEREHSKSKRLSSAPMLSRGCSQKARANELSSRAKQVLESRRNARHAREDYIKAGELKITRGQKLQEETR